MSSKWTVERYCKTCLMSGKTLEDMIYEMVGQFEQNAQDWPNGLPASVKSLRRAINRVVADNPHHVAFRWYMNRLSSETRAQETLEAQRKFDEAINSTCEMVKWLKGGYARPQQKGWMY